MIKGLYETHLFVEDLERSVAFYDKVMGLKKCHFVDERRIAFFWIGKEKQSMLGLWEKPKEQIDIRHYAFECDPEWIINESVNFLKERNLSCWNFLQDGIARPMVFCWIPAIAIYFNDPDGHELEFIGVLDGKSRPDKGVVSYEEWLEMEKNDAKSLAVE